VRRSGRDPEARPGAEWRNMRTNRSDAYALTANPRDRVLSGYFRRAFIGRSGNINKSGTAEG